MKFRPVPCHVKPTISESWPQLSVISPNTRSMPSSGAVKKTASALSQTATSSQAKNSIEYWQIFAFDLADLE